MGQTAKQAYYRHACVLVACIAMAACAKPKVEEEATATLAPPPKLLSEPDPTVTNNDVMQAVTKVDLNKPKSLVTNSKTKFASHVYGVNGSPRVTDGKSVRKGGGRYQIGKPYTVKGKRYFPKLDPNYKNLGLASWYGPNFHGRLTANGEVYDQYALSAAHPTMPLPSYAKVTNVENGSSLVVRVNDRGPFSNKRIIDLSARAAQLLGYTHQGLAKVKVEYVGKAPLHGLDEGKLLASYDPGKIDINTLPPNGRGYVLLADAEPANTSQSAQSVQAFSEPTTPTRTTLAADEILKGPGIVPIPRPTTLLNSYAADNSQSGNTALAMKWFNTESSPKLSDGMNTVTHLQLGPFKSLSQIEKAEALMTNYGYVSHHGETAKGYMLQLTTVKSELSVIRSTALKNGIGINSLN